MRFPAPPDVATVTAGGLPALLDEAPCGFLSFSEKGIITHVNATLARLLGRTVEDLRGRDVKAVFDTPTRIFYQTHFFPLIQLHHRADEIYLTLQAADGNPVYVLANAVRHERHGVVFIDCVLMQIRERQRYEEELLRARRAADEANRAKVEFLSMMSHDLRTPLNAVNGYADLLLLGVRGDLNDDQARDIRRIQDAGKFLLGLINDILSFARLELGKADLQIMPVRVRDALLQTETLLGSRFQEAGVEYARDEVPPDLIASADPERLQQILLNLLTNASKFTPKTGRVTVAARREGESVRIVVADTGRGIPPERLQDIFKPFSQVDPQLDRKAGGVGLGLAIGRELARSMGGDLTVRSEVGRGSEFTITLRPA